MPRIRLRPSPATVIASVALMVALAGTGYAATSLPPNSVGTAQLKLHAVTQPKMASNSVGTAQVKNGSLLNADFKVGQVPAGPAGPPGGQGAQGPPGAPATSLWAVVDNAGGIGRSNNLAASGSGKIGTGQYVVVFNKDVTGCSYQATLGGPTTGQALGFVSVGQRVGNPAALLVLTFNFVGSSADEPFSIAVFC